MSDANANTSSGGKTGFLQGKNRKWIYVGAAVVVLLVVAVLILNVNVGGGSPTLAAFDNQQVPAALMQKLNIPDSIANQVGIGYAVTQVIKVNGTPTDINGKPEFLYIGAEFCPYCGFQRWAMIIALSRFGTFSGVKYMTSAAKDVFPNTPTFSFYNSTYTSSYITFVPVETTTNQPYGTSYQPLQYPNASENATINKFDPNGGIPFEFFGNNTVIDGVSYNDPGILDSNWTQITSEIYNTSTVQSQAVVGAANLLTVQICQMDNNQPSSVCTQSYVTNIEKQLG